jgi:predicted dehydrogenase
VTELGFALLGCGRVSRKHVDALAAIPGARLVAACDVQLERARELGVPAFADLDAMLRAVPEIDVVSILTPTGNHPEHVLRIAGHGKHVVVEKPMALTVDDADEMIDACARAGVQLFVVKQSRHNPPVRRLRDALDAGRFGKLVMGTVRVRWCRRQDYYDADPWRGTRELDGGVLANQASHHIDLLTWMLGPVQSVYAMAATQLVDIETEDTAAVLLRFASGALGVVEATMATRPVDLEGSLSILGERGSVVIGGYSMDRLDVWNFDPPMPTPKFDAGQGHRSYLEQVVRALRGESANVVDGVEGRKSVEVIDAIYESIRTRREVVLEAPRRIRSVS